MTLSRLEQQLDFFRKWQQNVDPQEALKLLQNNFRDHKFYVGLVERAISRDQFRESQMVTHAFVACCRINREPFLEIMGDG